MLVETRHEGLEDRIGVQWGDPDRIRVTCLVLLAGICLVDRFHGA